jgi:hypothetical protein
MSAAYAIANVLHSLQALKERVPPNEWSHTPLPVVAAPAWWLEEVRAELGAPADTVPCEIHGCSVIQRDELQDPVLIDHDGKIYPILPAWAKASEAAKQ